MLVWLAEHLVKYYSGFNVFSYLTFRAIVSLLTALFISLWMGPRMIAHLQKLSFGQVVRNDGPESHFSKRGTPTMGGIMILTAIVISVLLWAYPSNPYVWCVLVVLVGYGVIGFVDDYRKVVRKDTKGLIARWKYFWMSVIALGVAFALYLAGKDTPATQLVVPFFKDVMPQLGLFYILLAYFVIVGTGNAVNLTDGLDGLAIMPTVFVAGGFALVAWATGNMNFANYLHIPYLRHAGELVIVCTAIVGAGLGPSMTAAIRTTSITTTESVRIRDPYGSPSRLARALASARTPKEAKIITPRRTTKPRRAAKQNRTLERRHFGK